MRNVRKRLHDNLIKVGRLVRSGELEGVSLDAGKLKISRPKKDEPEGMDSLTRLVYDLVPRVKATDMLVEVDFWSGFSDHFTHLKTGEPVKDKKVLYAALMADGVNLGLTKMAEATDDPKITYERLAWASDWHVRDEIYQAAIATHSSTSITGSPSPATGAKEQRLLPMGNATRPAATKRSRARSTPATVGSLG